MSQVIMKFWDFLYMKFNVNIRKDLERPTLWRKIMQKFYQMCATILNPALYKNHMTQYQVQLILGL